MKPGKLLRIKPGFNPNSSSLGSDLTFLLIGSAAVALIVNIVDTGLRLWKKQRGTSTDGDS